MPVSILTHEGKRGKTELMIFVARADDEFTPEFAQNPVTKLVEHSEHRWFDLEEIKHSDDIHSKQKQDIIAPYESIRSIINNAVYDSQNVDISSAHWDYS